MYSLLKVSGCECHCWEMPRKCLCNSVLSFNYNLCVHFIRINRAVHYILKYNYAYLPMFFQYLNKNKSDSEIMKEEILIYDDISISYEFI